jgi:hypothetical protein
MALDVASTSGSSSTMTPGRQPGCIIYSFGVTDASSFEASLATRAPHCTFWGLDGTATSWGSALVSAAADAQMGDRIHFSTGELAGTSSTKSVPAKYTVQDLMALNGHDHIDILRLDARGAEIEALSSLVEFFLNHGNEVPVAQLLVKVYATEERGVDDFVEWWEVLEEAGFRPFRSEPDLLVARGGAGEGQVRANTYSFLNIRDRRSPFI